MKKRIKGLVTLWLTLILVLSVTAIPAYAAETTYAYYYEGAEALRVGYLMTESDGITDGTPSTDAFEYGDGAAAVTDQVGNVSIGQVGWKVWGAWITSGGFDVYNEYVVKSLTASVSDKDYEYLGYSMLVIERLFLTEKATDIIITPDETLSAGIIYSATLSRGPVPPGKMRYDAALRRPF